MTIETGKIETVSDWSVSYDE